MAEQALNHQKKCPNCGQWSGWNLQIDDRCQHCGALLDADSLRRQEQKKEEERRQAGKFSVSVIEILPTDTAFTRFYKRIIQAFQLTFIGILSFIIWLISLLAG